MGTKWKKKTYKEKDLTGYGHKPGTIIQMSDRKYKVGKDGEYRRIAIINKKILTLDR